MNKNGLSRYWLFQISGWGLFALINVFFAFLFNKFSEPLILRLLFFVEIGILFSHLMRIVIKRSGVLLKNLQNQIIFFIILAIAFSVLITSVQTPFEQLYGLKRMEKPQPLHVLFFYNFGSVIPLLFIWNLIYFMYHYVAKSRKQQLDTLRLEGLVKELELKTIKAHINPHFIFNSLNSIRALIDENPERAREAVTELSNILRSSLKTEKGETVSFKDELRIVKDYLALENMRFEDRLKIEFDVDYKSLDKQVPPMMLQTLVENAIKHGINKRVEGGTVRVISDIKDECHVLAVQNTGHLNGYGNGHNDGFGLSSTKDRLSLLYGDKATFQIKQLDESLVEAKISIPTTLN
jgi:two-component sensor histidine kinase